VADVFETIETAKVYGRQAQASLAALGSIDIQDPATAVMIINDQVKMLASAIGFAGEFAESIPLVGIAAKLIQLVPAGINRWMDKQGIESDEARDEQQLNIISGLQRKYGKGCAWAMELESNALPGDDGYYEDIGGTGLPGVLSGSFGPALPLDTRPGCYRQGFAGRGKSAGAGAWRLWPGLYPLFTNEPYLAFINMTYLKGREALEQMISLSQVPFSFDGNLWVNGEDVARTLSNFIDWYRPGLAKLPLNQGTPTPIRNKDGTTSPCTYRNADGTLHTEGPTTPYYWIGTMDRAVEPDAYNFVLKTHARWFALREQILRLPGWSWSEPMKEAAEGSSEPSVQAALKRINDKPKFKRVGRALPPVTGRGGTTNTAGPRPAHARPEAKRVGRPSAVPTLTPERFDVIRGELFPWLAGR